jgi:hypothetical protein
MRAPRTRVALAIVLALLAAGLLAAAPAQAQSAPFTAVATDPWLPFHVNGVAYTSPAALIPSPAQATLSVDQSSAMVGDTCYVFSDWYDATHDQVVASGPEHMTVTVAPGAGTAYLGRYTAAEWYSCIF